MWLRLPEGPIRLAQQSAGSSLLHWSMSKPASSGNSCPVNPSKCDQMCVGVASPRDPDLLPILGLACLACLRAYVRIHIDPTTSQHHKPSATSSSIVQREHRTNRSTMAQTMRTCRPNKAAFGARSAQRVRTVNRTVRVCAAPQTASAPAQTEKKARHRGAITCMLTRC
jgi:hypothetical protein